MKKQVPYDELVMSMFVFMQEQDGERMLKATADACRMIAKESEKELDGTSMHVWNKAGEMIDGTVKFLEEN